VKEILFLHSTTQQIIGSELMRKSNHHHHHHQHHFSNTSTSVSLLVLVTFLRVYNVFFMLAAYSEDVVGISSQLVYSMQVVWIFSQDTWCNQHSRFSNSFTEILPRSHYPWWHNQYSIGLAIKRRRVQLMARHSCTLHSNFGQVIHTYMPPSPSSNSVLA